MRNRKQANTSSDEDKQRPLKHPAIQFLDMTKRFGSFVAVDSMNLNLYKDEIFCFLGHNGAGKTTSLNVLMGKEQASEGDVVLHTSPGKSLNISEDLQQA